MNDSQNILITKPIVPKLAVIILGLVFGFGMFAVGFDQGQLFSIVLGDQAYKDLYIHELTHDLRHAAGFPCH